jgi:glycosyltransferase involved in cell wall biosynthesis
MFISTYDTLVFDRRLVREGGIGARLLRSLERLAIRSADFVILDTRAHASRIESLFELSPGSCSVVWVGAEVEFFRPSTRPLNRGGTEPLEVVFYGQFIPLHGVPTIVSAARLMQEESVNWTLIGRGQESAEVKRMLAEVPLPKLRCIDWVDYAELGSWIARSDLCLGIFGVSSKASSVIPNKVFQIVAAGRPLVTRDSPAVRELLAHVPPCVYLVPAGDAQALAMAVREHLAYLTVSPTPTCHLRLVEKIAASAIGRQFDDAVITRLRRN